MLNWSTFQLFEINPVKYIYLLAFRIRIAENLFFHKSRHIMNYADVRILRRTDYSVINSGPIKQSDHRCHFLSVCISK